MTDKYKLSIGEVSDILQVPRSTLRFWEEKGLIKSLRDSSNDYREFTLATLFEICDVLLFRSLGISVRELRNFHEMNVIDMENILNMTGQNLDRQIIELQGKKQKVLAYMQRIEELKEMLSEPYRKGIPDITKVIPETMIDQASIKRFLDDPSQASIVVEDPEHPVIQHALAVTLGYGEVPAIWTLPEEPPLYLECLVRISLDSPNDNNLGDICHHVSELGYKPGKLIGRFMGTVYRMRNDYYKGWIELL